ncbi:MAG: DUF3592 domain-containing protein, partial [Victivallales bacterium]|nr:DUF3592 domain-containing protein [Victivallales bacterium]
MKLTSEKERNIEKIFYSLGGWIFVVIGALGLIVASHVFWGKVQPYRWEKTPARVVSAKRWIRPGDYALQVTYSYCYRGADYRGDRWEMEVKKRSGNFIEIAAAARQYAKGTPIICYVNPDDPRQVILHRSVPWLILLAMMGALMVFVMGCGILYWYWRLSEIPPSGALKWRDSPVEGRGVVMSGGGIVGILFLGLIFIIMCFPFMRMLASQSWEKTPCYIISSRLTISRSNSGSAHCYTEIVYRYRFRGRDYIGDRYDCWYDFYGYKAKKAMVEQYPEGEKTFCYVNPAAPELAVLLNRFRPLPMPVLQPLLAFMIVIPMW